MELEGSVDGWSKEQMEDFIKEHDITWSFLRKEKFYRDQRIQPDV